MKLYYEDLTDILDSTIAKAFNEYWLELEHAKTPEEQKLREAMLDEMYRDMNKIADRIRDYGNRVRTGNI